MRFVGGVSFVAQKRTRFLVAEFQPLQFLVHFRVRFGGGLSQGRGAVFEGPLAPVGELGLPVGGRLEAVGLDPLSPLGAVPPLERLQGLLLVGGCLVVYDLGEFVVEAAVLGFELGNEPLEALLLLLASVEQLSELGEVLLQV